MNLVCRSTIKWRTSWFNYYNGLPPCEVCTFNTGMNEIVGRDMVENNHQFLLDIFLHYPPRGWCLNLCCAAYGARLQVWTWSYTFFWSYTALSSDPVSPSYMCAMLVSSLYMYVEMTWLSCWPPWCIAGWHDANLQVMWPPSNWQETKSRPSVQQNGSSSLFEVHMQLNTAQIGASDGAVYFGPWLHWS